MTSDSGSTVRFAPALGIIQAALRAAVLGVHALLQAKDDPQRIYEPDPWSTEAPFVSSGWPRS